MMGWQSRANDSGGTTRILWCMATVVLLLAGACGSGIDAENDQEAVENDGEGPLGIDRFEHIEPLDLEPGEAKEGIHLRPGTEVIRLDYSADDPDIDVDFDELEVRLRGEARDELAAAGGIWSDDILLGQEFVFLFRDIREDGSEVVIDVAPFELVRVIHGEWEQDVELDQEEMNEVLAMEGMLSSRFSDWEDLEVGGEGVSANEDVAGEETNFDIDLQRFVGDTLEDGAAEEDAQLGGKVSIPIDWDTKFKGRIGTPGRSTVSGYRECESPTEIDATPKRPLLEREADASESADWEQAKLLQGTEQMKAEHQPERFCMDFLKLKGSIGLNASTEFYLQLMAGAKFSVGEMARFLQMQTPLVDGLALSFFPYIEAGVEAKVDGFIQFLLSGSTDIEIPFGFIYDPNGEGIGFIPNDIVSGHGVPKQGNIDVDMDGESQALTQIYTELGLGVMISDAASSPQLRAAGPKLGFRLGAQAELDPFQVLNDGVPEEPCLGGGLFIEAFGDFDPCAELASTESWSWGVDDTDFDKARTRWWLEEFPKEDPTHCIPLGPDDLEIRLTWLPETHMDLQVTTPTGNTIGPGQQEADGGEYKQVPMDATAPCLQDSSQSCRALVRWDGTHPPTGEYTVTVLNNGNPDPNFNNEPANFEIEVVTGATQLEHATNVAAADTTTEGLTFTLGE